MLIEAYETKHFPILPPDPIDALVYFLENRGLTERDLEPYIGNQGLVSDVLNRRRALTMTMIRRLHKGLGISADVLIQPYALQKRAA